jgi:hypothetical protein
VFLINDDIFHTNRGSTEKQKFVQLHPDPLRWISNHWTRLNKYSQFSYEISVEDKCLSARLYCPAP